MHVSYISLKEISSNACRHELTVCISRIILWKKWALLILAHEWGHIYTFFRSWSLELRNANFFFKHNPVFSIFVLDLLFALFNLTLFFRMAQSIPLVQNALVDGVKSSESRLLYELLQKSHSQYALLLHKVLHNHLPHVSIILSCNSNPRTC